MPRGITAEIGRKFGFGYEAGPPESFGIGWVRFFWHAGLREIVLEIGTYQVTLRRAEASVADAQGIVRAQMQIRRHDHVGLHALAARARAIHAPQVGADPCFDAAFESLVTRIDVLELGSRRTVSDGTQT